MNNLTSRQVNALLRFVRLEANEHLERQAKKILKLNQTMDVLAQRQSADILSRRSFIVKQLIETAIRSLKPDDQRGDNPALRAHTLLDAFYLQHKSRAETLAMMKLGGGSFDRVKAHALDRLTDALNQLCETILHLHDPISDSSVVPVITVKPRLSFNKGQRLPYRPYRILWGRQHESEQVYAWLVQSDAPPVICISGMGGIGKTALAFQIAERLYRSPNVADVLWESAKREILVGAHIQSARSDLLTFSKLVDRLILQTGLAEASTKTLSEKCMALTQLFQSQTYLIVLDNLDESENEVELIRQILDLLGKSRLLVTSRHQHNESLPLTRSLHLTGLREHDSVEFLKEESAFRGLPELAQADFQMLHEIYTLTGGAPLALHLVIGQAHLWPIKTVLAHLRQARDPDVEFYSFLFKQDWLTLSESAQMILIYIGRMIRTSITYAQLEHAQLIENGLDAAIESLVCLSLLQTNVSLSETEKRYSIHPLVRHFVISELPLLWKPPVR